MNIINENIDDEEFLEIVLTEEDLKILQEKYLLTHVQVIGQTPINLGIRLDDDRNFNYII